MPQRKETDQQYSGLQWQIFNMQKSTKENNTQQLRKKNCICAAHLHPSWCIQSTLLILQAWEEDPLAHCILYALTHFDSRHREQREQLCFIVPDGWFWGHMQAMPGSQVSPVPGPAAVSLHHRLLHCSQDTCDWRQSLTLTCRPDRWSASTFAFPAMYWAYWIWGRLSLTFTLDIWSLCPWRIVGW